MLNKTYNEDCLKTMKRLVKNNTLIDLTVTSPPYDNLRTYKDDVDKSWGEHAWKPIIKSLYEVTKPGGVVVWVIGDASIKGSESGSSFRQALYFMECGFNLHDTMIWEKGSFAFPSQGRYHQTFEYMFVFSKGKPNTFNSIKDRKNKYTGTRGASGRKKNGERNKGTSTVRSEWGQRFNVWHYPIGGGHSATDKVAYEHPAIFPEKLAEDHIKTWSNEGDLIYDPFMGSGTTAKMSILNNRNWVGSEISKEYIDITKRRLKQL